MMIRITGVIQGRRLDDGNLMTTMGQQQCTLMMTAMAAMAEALTATATATGTAMAMMPPFEPTAMMLMKTTVAI
jgi:hypothetical protein